MRHIERGNEGLKNNIPSFFRLGGRNQDCINSWFVPGNQFTVAAKCDVFNSKD